jgi:hypothetical protein
MRVCGVDIGESRRRSAMENPLVAKLQRGAEPREDDRRLLRELFARPRGSSPARI